MINYELAKQLKGAGYPMPTRWGTVLENCTCGSTEYLGENKVHAAGSDCLLMAPTLEELIAAVGKDFALLEQVTPELWVADYHDENLDCHTIEGRTPSEAVAKLWLFIHHKNIGQEGK